MVLWIQMSLRRHNTLTCLEWYNYSQQHVCWLYYSQTKLGPELKDKTEQNKSQKLGAERKEKWIFEQKMVKLARRNEEKIGNLRKTRHFQRENSIELAAEEMREWSVMLKYFLFKGRKEPREVSSCRNTFCVNVLFIAGMPVLQCQNKKYIIKHPVYITPTEKTEKNNHNSHMYV